MQSGWPTSTVTWLLLTWSAAAAPLGEETPLFSFPPFDADSWQASNPEDLEITEDALELSTQGVAYAWIESRLTNTTLVTEMDPLQADAVFLALRVQANPPLSGYVVDISREGMVNLISLVDGDDTLLASREFPSGVLGEQLMICHELRGERLRSWIWPKSIPQPQQPTLEALLPAPLAFVEGRAAVGVRGGTATFRKIDVGAQVYRPAILSLLPLKKEPRFNMSWESIPNHVYRIDASGDREEWHPHYWVKAASEHTEVVIPASFAFESAPGLFYRVINLTASVGVDVQLDIIVPTTPRLALAWTSTDDRVYSFEWSKDLIAWESYGPFVVEGEVGTDTSTAVLPLPEPLTNEDASPLYVRVIDLEDKDTYGIVPLMPGG